MNNFGHLFLEILCILLGIASIIYYAVTKSRGITFAAFFLVLGIMFIAFGIMGFLFKDIYMNKKMVMIYKCFKIVIAFFIISFIIIEACIIYWGSKHDSFKADYVIIFGAGVRGTIPSLTLYERLRSGLEYIRMNPEAMVILSGGKGTGEDISEAEAMKRFLIANGVDEKKIILEEKSRNTRENIMYSKAIINNDNKNKNDKVILVTSNFHMMRAKLLAARAGIDAYCFSAKIPAWLAPTYFIREYFAVFKSLIFDRIL